MCRGGSAVTALLAQSTAAPVPPTHQQRSPAPSSRPLSFLRRSAAVFPDKTAVVHGNRGTSYDYRTFAERVDRLASALQRGGAAQARPGGVPLPQHPRDGRSALRRARRGRHPRDDQHAAQRAGGRLHPPPLRRALPLRRRNPSGVDGAARSLRHHRRPRSTTPGPLAIPTRTSWRRGSPEPVPPSLADEEETISINYTSGTTGPPKGVLWTHRGAYLHALGNVIETGLTAESVFLWTVPMFHCNGWCFPWAVVAVGGTQVCLRKVEPSLVWELIDAYGVTHYNGAPTVHLAIANHPAAHRLSPPRHGRHWRLAALADAARPAARAEPAPDPHLRPDRDRTVHRQRVATRVGDRSPPTNRPSAWLARARAAWLPIRCGWSTTRCATCRAMARPWARS